MVPRPTLRVLAAFAPIAATPAERLRAGHLEDAGADGLQLELRRPLVAHRAAVSGMRSPVAQRRRRGSRAEHHAGHQYRDHGAGRPRRQRDVLRSGDGGPSAYGDCGATVIDGPGHMWCYGQTKPVPSGTAIYGRGELHQGNEYSFAYSPTPFTAPTPPTPPPPPGPCTDCDGDGSRADVDCDDANPAIHPGSVDVPGNHIDEDCSGTDAHLPQLAASVLFDDERPNGDTVFTRLLVQPARAGSTVRLRCSGGGCTFKTRTRKVKKTAAKLNLLAWMHHARLRPHARLEVQVTKQGTIGRSFVFTMRPSGKGPTHVVRCLTAHRRPVKCAF